MTAEEIAAHDALILPRFAVLSAVDDISRLGDSSMQMVALIEGRDPVTPDDAALLYHRALAALHECKAARPGGTFVLVAVSVLQSV